MSEDAERPTVVCQECGTTEALRWYEGVNKRLQSEGLCFDCSFWCEKVRWAETGLATDRAEDRLPPRFGSSTGYDAAGRTVVRVNANHYVIQPERGDTPLHCLGFSGQRFVIEFHDGRRVESTNLWHQGEIPERFRDRLPDNASFAHNRHTPVVKYGGNAAPIEGESP